MATLPTTPTAATVGSKITASNWNSQVQLPEEFFRINRPICYVVQTVAQTLTASGTAYAITMDSETLDRDGQHSTSSNTDRIVIGNTLGWYRVTGTVCYNSNSAGDRRAFIYVNGTAYAATVTGNAGTSVCSVTVTTLVQATSATDYVALWGMQNSGGSLNTYVGSTPYRSTLTAEWIGS